ncbi:MAG: hypothetical protein E5Y51_03765 [Mesorhizobium sp.]|nr:MAG: hypothetical protein E5Y51_03765 [Mesorhizobium sp.]
MSIPKQDPRFEAVCSLEDPLATATDICKALAFIAETMSNDVGTVVQRLAWLAIGQIDAAEKIRGELFDLTHPTKGGAK